MSVFVYFNNYLINVYTVMLNKNKLIGHSNHVLFKMAIGTAALLLLHKEKPCESVKGKDKLLCQDVVTRFSPVPSTQL
jgi:hypothetical protein